MPARDKRYCTVCRDLINRPFKSGPQGRPHAKCPRCNALERYRFLALLIDLLRPHLGRVGTLLDVAPTPHSIRLLPALEAERSLRIDLSGHREVDVLGDLTRLPLADGSVDLMLCYHVLEHVPDDAAAMAEMARVLAPEGLALVQVPIRWGTTTDEDPHADVEERIHRFGQHDHVRYYGDDFEDRLTAHSLSFLRVRPEEVLGRTLCDYLAVIPHETVWLVGRAGRSFPTLAHPGLQHLLETLVTQLGERTAQRDHARDRVARLRQRLNRARAGDAPRRPAEAGLQALPARVRALPARVAGRARALTGSGGRG